MEIIKVKIDEITPYKNNAKKHTKKQIEQIKKSILEFQNNDPIAIWGNNNIIVEGHGRYEALKELGYTEIECIRLDHLTDEQRKAYTLVHNKLNMDTGFENDLLLNELEDITNIDMIDFDFDLEKILEDLGEDNERHRTSDTYNLDIVDFNSSSNNFWQMPIIKNDNFIPSNLIGFNYAKTSKNKNTGIHFYLDDYQFERLWKKPEDYVQVLQKYECILTPDFSLYNEMPMPMKIWNIYRSRQLGQYYQQQGIKVIATISWAEKETFEFCFEGIEKHSIVSISTIGVKKNKENFNMWVEGVEEMIKRIQPSTIIVYGGKVDYDFKDIKVVYYDNTNTKKFKCEE